MKQVKSFGAFAIIFVSIFNWCLAQSAATAREKKAR